MKQESLIDEPGARVVSRTDFRLREVSAQLLVSEERREGAYVEVTETVEVHGPTRGKFALPIAVARDLHAVLGKVLDASARRAVRRGKEPPATREEALAAAGVILDKLRADE